MSRKKSTQGRCKPLLLVLLMFTMSIFLATSVSAIDWDNTYEYNPLSQTAYIHNCDFWLGWCWNEGEVLAEATLTWGNTTVTSGIDTHVGSFNYTPKSSASSIQDLDLVDLKNGQTMTRGKQYKVKTYFNESVDDYETQCTGTNETNITCEQVEIGSHIELKSEWIPLSNPNYEIEVGETYEIGVFVDTERGDYGDWLPTFAGVKIAEWSTFTQSDTISYYKLDETSGTTATDSHGSNDGTRAGSPVLGVTGKIETAWDFEESTSDSINLGSSSTLNTPEMSMSAWVKPESFTGTEASVVIRWGSGNAYSIGWKNSDGTPYIKFYTSGGENLITSSGGTMTTGTWHHLVATWDSTTGATLYVDGSSVGTINTYSGSINSVAETTQIGALGSAVEFDGIIDEVAFFDIPLTQDDVTDLYNSGDGFAYPFEAGDTPPTITTPLPANNTVYTTTTTVNFNATVSDAENLVNVSLLIDGVIDQTDTSGLNNTLYTFSKSLSTGIHNWSFIAWDNSTQNTTSETRTVNISIDTPMVTLQLPTDDYYTQSNSTDFIVYVSDNHGVQNVTLYLDGVVNETSTAGTNNTNYTFSKTLIEGSYDWYVKSYNTLGFDADSSTWTLNVDLNDPTIDANVTTPIIYNFGDLISVDFTATDTFLDTCWYDYPENLTKVNTTVLSGNSFTESEIDRWIYNQEIVTKNTTSQNGAFSFESIFKKNINPTENITFNLSETSGTSSYGATYIKNITLSLYNYTSSSYNTVDSIYHSSWTGMGYFKESINFNTNNISTDYNNSGSLMGKIYVEYSDYQPGFLEYDEIQTLEAVRFNSKTIFNCISGVEQEIDIASSRGYIDITVYANDGAGKETSEAVSFAYDTIAPTISITSPAESVNYSYSGEIKELNTTVTDTNLDSCWYEYNNINTTIDGCLSGIINSSSFGFSGTSEITVYANDTVGNIGVETLNWTTKVGEISRTYNNQSYETQQEQFNISLNANSSLTKVELIYNGINYPTTKDGVVYTSTIDVPAYVTGNISFKWEFTYDGGEFDSTSSYQQVNETVFILCNANYTDDFLNISFKDEAALTAINASIPLAEFDYYLGSGTSKKTYEYYNVTNHYNYTFCATPNITLKVEPYIQYKQGTEYPQKIWDSGAVELTGEVTNQVLYLLNAVDGLYVTFQIINSAEQAISDVLSTAVRTILGVDVVLGIGLTDAAGAVTFWLNPDFIHVFSFSSDDYETYETSFAPTQPTYTLTLGGGDYVETDCSRGVAYSVSPSGNFLDRNENYNFLYTLSSSYWDVSSFTASLYYGNGTLISTDTDTTNGGTITFSGINVSNESSMYLDYDYEINSTVCYEGSTNWVIQSIDGREFSIWHFFEDANLYMDANILGIMGESGTDTFAKSLLAILILVLTTGVLTSRYGISSEAAIMGIIFGLVLLMDFGLGFIPTIQVGSLVAIDYFVSFISFLMLIVYIIKEERY